MRGRTGTVLLAVGAGLVLADGSIVALALPDLLGALDTTVEGVAAVVAVYTATVAVALLPAERARRRIGGARLGAAGFAAFAAASLACGLAGSLPALLALRALQAAGGAAGHVAAVELLHAPAGRDARRLWLLAAVAGTAAGPALGGALTQLLDWRAIFLAQVPLGALAAASCAGALARRSCPVSGEGVALGGVSGEGAARGYVFGESAALGGVPGEGAALGGVPGEGAPPGSGAPRSPFDLRAGCALGLVSAALTAVLVLLVLILVAGWSIDPLAAAAAVTILPAAALASSRLGGDPRARAAAGCLLVAGGVGALAAVATASVWWTVAPQLLAGAGMGLALPALGGELLPERTPADAARVLTLRHAGIALALALLAPVVADRVDHAVQTARERGVALVLDARIDPARKLELAPGLVADVDERDARGELRRAFDAHEGEIGEDQRPAYEELRRRADETLTAAVGDGFRVAFLITAALALLGAIALAAPGRGAAAPGRGAAAHARGAAAHARGATAPGRGAAGPGRGAAAPPSVPSRLLVAAALAALAVPLATAAVAAAVAPEPVEIANPCRARELPHTGGLAGAVQDAALVAVDRAACRFGSSREELVLALADEREARRFEERHGVDPRSLRQLVEGVLGF